MVMGSMSRRDVKVNEGSTVVMALGIVSLDLTCPNGKILRILGK
jgi:hypothetical protein